MGARVRLEAEEVVQRYEPELASFIYSTILHHDQLGNRHHLSGWPQRLDHAALSGELIRQAYAGALRANPGLGEIFRADIVATIDRDPATSRLIEPVLYYKGFHAIQTYPAGALAVAETAAAISPEYHLAEPVVGGVPSANIHPAAEIGRGIFLDHATGLVVGETAAVGDDVSILHDVTLGGTGAREWEDRHPKIRYGVMIGAGAKILGNIEVGHCARIAAELGGDQGGRPTPSRSAGVPARVVGAGRLSGTSAHHGSIVSRRAVMIVSLLSMRFVAVVIVVSAAACVV